MSSIGRQARLSVGRAPEQRIRDVVSFRYIEVSLAKPTEPDTCDGWFCSYGAAQVGVATAKTPCGPYTYKASWKPLGADSRDEGLFQDGT